MLRGARCVQRLSAWSGLRFGPGLSRNGVVAITHRRRLDAADRRRLKMRRAAISSRCPRASRSAPCDWCARGCDRCRRRSTSRGSAVGSDGGSRLPVTTPRLSPSAMLTTTWPGEWPKHGSQRNAVVEAIIVVDQHDLLGFLDRQRRFVLEADAVDARIAVLIGVVPIVVFGAADDVLGVRERRNPAAVDQPRVPADMVPMKMGAHHVSRPAPA